LVPWVGKHVLHLSGDVSSVYNGSGDKTFHYVQLHCIVVLAILIAMVWSVADRERARYDKLFAWLRIYLRYVLGYTMLSYGMAKIFKGQFPYPSPMRLLEPYGESSPIGLLWTFMGYSTPYTVFSGLAEATGGMLLFFRRTTTLGALVMIAVMTNIVMLNFCYDVPVKLYSLNLLLTSVSLLAPDVQRLANVLIFNRPTEPRSFGSPPHSPWRRYGSAGVKMLMIALLIYPSVQLNLERRRAFGDNAPNHPLYGMYEVVDFARNGETLPPLLTEIKRWRKMSVGMTDMWIQTMDDLRQRFTLKLDLVKRTIALSPYEDRSKSFVLTYAQPDPAHLVVEGVFMGDSITGEAPFNK
jgi:uncharacterized membrane protein YphA (DoxX/SURF4 family)